MEHSTSQWQNEMSVNICALSVETVEEHLVKLSLEIKFLRKYIM